MNTSPIAKHHIEVRMVQVQDAVNKLDDAVIAGRKAGLTWDEIGSALGMSRQAAHEQYRHVVEG